MGGTIESEMRKIDEKKILESLAEDVYEILAYTKVLEEMDDDRLNIKSSPEKWNTNECLDHMNKATELYIDQIELKIDAELIPSKRGYYKSGFFAEFSINGLKPAENGDIKHKMNTLKRFVPNTSQSGNVLKRFQEGQKRLIQILGQLEGKDLRSFKVTTAFGKILKFYVGDAVRFLTAHNQRHILQIKKIHHYYQQSENG